jgi:hypothetical protein
MRCCCWTTAGQRVAGALFIDAETVRDHRRLYETSGVVGVERLNYEGSEPALSQAQPVALGRELDLSALYDGEGSVRLCAAEVRGRLYAERHDQAAEAIGVPSTSCQNASRLKPTPRCSGS